MAEAKEWWVSWVCKLSYIDSEYSAVSLRTGFWEESEGMVCLQGRHSILRNLCKGGPQCWHCFSMHCQARFGAWAWPRHVSKSAFSFLFGYKVQFMFFFLAYGLAIWSSTKKNAFTILFYLKKEQKKGTCKDIRRVQVILCPCRLPDSGSSQTDLLF